jgi:hypothetical protein
MARDAGGEILHRQSFTCRTREGAREVVQALRRLRAACLEKDPSAASFNRKLKGGAGTQTLDQALDLVNDNLAISVALKVDPKGILTLNGPDDIYRVDLARAEFALNDLNDEPRVRIYGDWCIETFRGHGRDRQMSRESFTTRTRQGARDVVRALYTVKAAFTGMDPAAVAALRNVTGERIRDYKTIAQAVDAINDRLDVSILMGVDAKGEVVVNAPDRIYRFNILDCQFRRARERSWFFGLVRGFDGEGVTIEGRKGLQKFEDGHFYDTVDEETFSCRSSFEVREVVQALDFIQDQTRKTLH